MSPWCRCLVHLTYLVTVTALSLWNIPPHLQSGWLAVFSVAISDIHKHMHLPFNFYNLLQALKAKKATPITGADVGK